jgi:hypothetical protein
MKVTKASSRTALRDIDELIELGILEQEEAGGRSTSYRQEHFASLEKIKGARPGIGERLARYVTYAEDQNALHDSCTPERPAVRYWADHLKGAIFQGPRNADKAFARCSGIVSATRPDV